MTLKDDHLRIALARETIVLPRVSREPMLSMLEQSGSMHELREALESNEPPEVVRLTAAQKRALIQLIEQWARDVDGGLASALPPGILGLRDALLDELDA